MTHQLTVALPTSTFLPALGGVEVGLHNIAMRLTDRGHIPIVLAPATNVLALRKAGTQLPYRVVSFPPKLMTLAQYWPDAACWLLSRFFGRIQRRQNIDVWHGTVGYPTGVALVRFARNEIPHIIRCAGDDIQIVPDLGYGMRLDLRIDRLIRNWLPKADRLVAISETVADEYHALGVEPERVIRIPNGVDLARFAQPIDKSAVRRRLGLNADAYVFLTVGRNHRKKGLSNLIAATAQLDPSLRQRLAVVIAGSGTESLANEVASAGLGDCVHLLGPIGLGNTPGTVYPKLPTDDLVALYKSADAFVFPSHIETFGIALVEAMAAGLPVITTDGPGCCDIVDHGAFGDMVAVGDDAALAAAMIRIIDDTAHKTQLAEKSLQRAQDFAWDTVVDKYVDAYSSAINRPR